MAYPLIELELRRCARASTWGFIFPFSRDGLLRAIFLGVPVVLLIEFMYWVASDFDRRELLLGVASLLVALPTFLAIVYAYVNPLIRGAGALDDDRKNDAWPALILASVSPTEFYFSKLVYVMLPYLRLVLLVLPLMVLGIRLLDHDPIRTAAFLVPVVTFSMLLSAVAILLALWLDDRAQVQFFTGAFAVAWVAIAIAVQRTFAALTFDPIANLYFRVTPSPEWFAIGLLHLAMFAPIAFVSINRIRRLFATDAIRSPTPLGPAIHYTWAKNWAGPLGRLYLAGTTMRQSVKMLRYFPIVAIPLALIPYPVLLPVALLLMTYVIVGSIHDARDNGSFTLLGLACNTDQALARAVRNGHVAQFLPLWPAFALLRVREYFFILDPDSVAVGIAAVPVLLCLAALESYLLLRLIVSVSCWSVIDSRPSATHSLAVLAFIATGLWWWAETIVHVPLPYRWFDPSGLGARAQFLASFTALRIVVYWLTSLYGLWLFRRYIRRPIDAPPPPRWKLRQSR